jgi:NADPH-dependent ferric siderophore reductase
MIHAKTQGGNIRRHKGEFSVNEITTYRDKTVPWTVSVERVERFDDAFVRVRCSLPSNTQLVPGDTIGVDVSPSTSTLRRYTVSQVTAGSFEFIGFRTERGPATSYLDQLSAGDELHGQGPERPVKLPAPEMQHVAVLGDETVVGTAVAITGATSHPVSVAVKTSRSLSQVLSVVGAHSVSACLNEDEMKAWLTNFLERHGTEDAGVFLVGEQSANQALRQHAFSLGLQKDRLATRTFWRPDKSGLE